MSPPDPVLVVGSYPPIPVAGAPVTVREVRRAWDMGDEVVVVSPRLSAADLTVPICGPLAGRRLDNVRRRTGARRLVLVVEPSFPFPPDPFMQLVTAAGLARAVRRFDHTRLVYAVAPGAGVGVSGRAWLWLAAAADDVVPEDGGPTDPGVTPGGPPEVAWSERPGHLARRALGPRRLAGLRRVRRLGRR